MESKGEYHFSRHHKWWRIRDSRGQCIKEVRTYEEAVRETYRLNGWGEPKYIKKEV